VDGADEAFFFKQIVDVLAARRQELWIFFAKNSCAKNAATGHVKTPVYFN
jgi:hypothetical protein